MAPLDITPELTIDDGELTFQASPGGGPGGQNVNRVATKVTISFDVAGSTSLTDEQREFLLRRLGSRLTKDGVLQVTSSEHRTQGANRRTAEERIVEVLRQGLVREKHRRATRPGRAARRRRLEGKHRRSTVKKGRSKSWDPDA
jgi:ribosome-associated protein